jgi:hypothetical protein
MGRWISGMSAGHTASSPGKRAPMPTWHHCLIVQGVLDGTQAIAHSILDLRRHHHTAGSGRQRWATSKTQHRTHISPIGTLIHAYLCDCVVVGPLDEDGAGLGVAHVLHKRVLVLPQRVLIHCSSVPEDLRGQLLNLQTQPQNA